MSARPALIAWASRGAGAIGIVTAVLYLGLIIGEDDTSQIPAALVFFVVMAGAGVAAWFADRAPITTGRRMMWLAFTAFFILGVLSVFSVGLLYLIAALLAIVSLSKAAPVRKRDPGGDGAGGAGW